MYHNSITIKSLDENPIIKTPQWVRPIAGMLWFSLLLWGYVAIPGVDATPPAISSTIPADASTDVPVGTPISVTFTEAIDPLTITADTFTVHTGGSDIRGTILINAPKTESSSLSAIAIFRPYSDLATNTTYMARIIAGVKDLAGNTMMAEYSWTFTTGTAHSGCGGG